MPWPDGRSSGRAAAPDQDDPDPRVRRRAQAVLMLAQGRRWWARRAGSGRRRHRVRAWRAWFLAGGRGRLADERRRGRPPKLGPADLALPGRGAAAGPRPTAGRSRSGASATCGAAPAAARVTVSVSTVYRAVRGLGYRYRRPRHDLRTARTRRRSPPRRRRWPGWEKGPRRRRAPAPSAWSISTSARSTATPA